MRYTLLPSNGQFYKANLHSHSTISDGKLTPEELKRIYKAQGYSILSITDHEFLQIHPELNDAEFLTIGGYEMQLKKTATDDFPFPRVCHLNLYAKTPEAIPQVCYCPDRMPAKMKDWPVSYIGPQYPAEYSIAAVNHIIAEANANGFLVSYNHPHWSMEDLTIFSQYDGMFAMEIYNTDCDTLGIPEWNIQSWEWMLRRNKRIFCLCGDDNHNKRPLDDPLCDCFGGWVMICAPSLTYTNVIHALETGAFYASTGPQIHSLFIEDGMLHVNCSEACDIVMATFGRKYGHIRAPEGQSLTSACFPIPKDCLYVRVEVKDHRGRFAESQAYWLDQIPSEALGESV